MSASWKIFRIVCIIQMTIAVFFVLSSVINFLKSFSFTSFASIITFLLVMMLSILAVNILNNNFPDTPVEGKQKKSFNRLFLLNFVFLAFIFGFVISEYRTLATVAMMIDKNLFELPPKSLIGLAAYVVLLILQLIILYGLFLLRRQLYINFMKRTFEFEEKK
jgi:hypothetical protein